jgi:hypothetical protein
MTHDLVWDLLRDEFFATSHFEHRFKRTGPDQIRIREPDLDFYLPYKNLSTSHIHLILLDVVLKLIQANGPTSPLDARLRLLVLRTFRSTKQGANI